MRADRYRLKHTDLKEQGFEACSANSENEQRKQPDIIEEYQSINQSINHLLLKIYSKENKC